jgi:type I restriction enzyme S subunit
MIDRNERISELPKGWVRTSLIDIADLILGQSPPSSTYNENGNGLPFYQGKAEFGSIYPITRKWCTQPKKIAEKDDVLISVRAPVGPTNLCPAKSAIGRGLAAIRGLVGIPSLFLLYYFRFIESELASKGTGTTFTAISGDQLKQVKVPIPPIKEQNRILEKIEELLTDLDAGVEALQRAKTLLKRYRQSVLKAAVTGELTKGWRESHKGEIEPASVLLERILGERRKKWVEEQRVKDIEQSRSKYIEPIEADISHMYALPKEWVGISLDQLSYHVTSGSRGWAKYYSDTGSIFIRVGNFNRLDIKLDFTNLAYVNAPEGFEEERTRIKAGDILLTITADVGMVGLVDNEISNKGQGYINQHVCLIRPLPAIFAKYIAYALTSEVVQIQIRNRQYGVTKKGLGLEDVKSLSVPFPPMIEQLHIVGEVEQRLSYIKVLEKLIDIDLKESTRLRQSILKHAFEGNLVPQDPNDEPASVLLERIRSTNKKEPSQIKMDL